MGWWSWAKPEPKSIAFPHAIVNLNVTQEALDTIQQALGGDPRPDGKKRWAAYRRLTPDRAVLFFTSESRLTDEQAYGIAHEVSHLTADLLGIPDRTHEKDRGVA